MQILKAIGLLMEYPDDELWECRDEALAPSNTMRQCWPTSLASCFMRRYWINKQNGAKCLTAGAPLHCCYSSMFMRSPAIAAGDGRFVKPV